MSTRRLEAFSDGVFAIIITIMVLEMKVPHGDSLDALRPLVPVFLSYVLSFFYVGIYWNNHHHMLQACSVVTGAMLWANLHLLFWLSLFPFATWWMGENHFTAAPTALYGMVLLMAAIAYLVLQQAIICSARAGLNPEEGGRARLEGQVITGAVYRRDRCCPSFLVDRPGNFCDRCADLADSGPSDRKTSRHITGLTRPTALFCSLSFANAATPNRDIPASLTSH